MEYISLQERILTECKDQTKEYLLKRGTSGFISLFDVLDSDKSLELANFLITGKKSESLDTLLCVIPLVLKNGKVFDTDKVISNIKQVCPNISGQTLMECLILFSFIFDLFYGTNIDDALNNINALNEECEKKLNITSIPKLDMNDMSSVKSDYKSIGILKDFIESQKYSNILSFNYLDNVSKAISLFLYGCNMEYDKSNVDIEKKYGDTIKNFLLSI